MDSIPFLRVGESLEDARYQLDRVSAARWLGDALAIASSGYEVRMYDSAGRHMSTTGRAGDGPGEYRTISWLGIGPDSSIVVYDSRLQRVSVYHRDGRFLRSMQLSDDAHGVLPQVAGILNDGSLLTLWFQRPSSVSGGIVPRKARMVLVGWDGRTQEVLGDVFGGEIFLREVPGRGYALRRAPFSPIPHYAARGSRIYVAEGVTYAVRVLDSHGVPIGVVGDSARRVEITEDIRSDFLRDTLRFWPSGERPRIEAEFRLMLGHEYLPLVADMHVDDVGHVWLRDATRDDHVWEVFAPDGSLAAHIELPPHRALLDVSDNVLVVLQSGQFGEDIVSAYRYSQRP